MSYWETMPLNVTSSGECKVLIKSSELLKKINNEMLKCHIDFNYTMYNESIYSDRFITEIKEFFDKYYDNGWYTFEMYKFLLKDAIIIHIHKSSDNNSLETLGYIISKSKKYHIFEKEMKNVMEINCFCIKTEYRNQYLGPYMLNVFIREGILDYNFKTAIYSINTDIKSPHYCLKSAYYRPTNLDILEKYNFLGERLIENKERLVNFNISKNRMVYLNGILPKKFNIIHKKLLQFKKDNFKVYEKTSKDDFSRSFLNKDFHHFIFYNSKDEIIDYISYYSCDNGKMYKIGYLYNFFINKYNIKNVNKIIDTICNYSKNIIDVFAFYDLFKTNNYLKNLNCIKGKSSTKFYMFNYSMYSINNYEHFIVHI
jgi:hypothetical protein